MNRLGQTRFNMDGPGGGPATRGLCIAILAVSLVSSLTQRKWGVGFMDLRYQVDAVLALEWWRLLTYPFVESTPFGLILSVIVLWLFGRWFESSWGSRDFVRFFLASAIGAGIFAVPLGMLINLVMPFQDLGMAEGPDAVIDAMMVALALNAPNSNVLFGFVLPMKAKTLVLILLGIEIIGGIQTGVSGLSLTLGGMLMGYLLTTGYWRPQRLFNLWRMWRLKRRRGLYVVPPKKTHTLH